MVPRVSTVKTVGLSIGSVTLKNLRVAPAPSIIAASSTSSPTLCSAARNSSMSVPEVAKIAMKMSTHIATDGPLSQSHHSSPSGPSFASGPGALVTPNTFKKLWMTPLGSESQFGPSTLRAASTAFTAPDEVNRKMKIVVIATELVTDGK